LETNTDFQVWPRNVYDVILGMQWLDLMDAWIGCKPKLVCDTKFDGLAFELIGVQTLFNTPLFCVKQIKKCVQRNAKLFTINVHEPINESVNENGIMKC
jgi:hypothetical protein